MNRTAQLNPKKFYLSLFIFSVLAIVFTYPISENAFFWDTVQLGSLHAHFYLDNNFSQFFLPESMDSGHPPVFGIYLAFIWKLFGKTLAISHYAMIPFLIGIIIYLHLFGRLFFQSFGFLLGFVLLFLIDPCVAGQMALVSPDVPLILFFLMSIYGIFTQKKTHLLLGIIGLCMISTRGMMTAAAFFVFDLCNYFWLEKNRFQLLPLFKKGWAYIPGGILGITFLIAHYYHTGWIGYHENSPWVDSFDKVNLSGFFKNILILGWRLVDLGRIILWIIILVIGNQIIQKKLPFDLKTKQLILLFLCMCIFLVPAMLTHKMLLGHRYLLPIFLVINILAVCLVSLIDSKKLVKRWFIIAGILGFIIGNFIIYPKKIAQSWDSTLANLPYFDLRKEMIAYIEQSKIPYQSVGSVFPNIQTFELIDLNGNQNKFVEKDFEKNDYIFYSNIFNDFTDQEIDILESEWTVVKQLNQNGICVILYKKASF